MSMLHARIKDGPMIWVPWPLPDRITIDGDERKVMNTNFQSNERQIVIVLEPKPEVKPQFQKTNVGSRNKKKGR